MTTSSCGSSVYWFGTTSSCWGSSVYYECSSTEQTTLGSIRKARNGSQTIRQATKCCQSSRFCQHFPFRFLRIWNSELHMALVSCVYLNLPLNNSLSKRSDQKVEFHRFLKMVTFQQFWPSWKNAWLWMAVVPNRLAYSKVWGVSGKIISISFIWYLVVVCVTTSLVTRTSWKVGLKW